MATVEASETKKLAVIYREDLSSHIGIKEQVKVTIADCGSPM